MKNTRFFKENKSEDKTTINHKFKGLFMKWFKHHSDMRHDPKIKRLIRNFGAPGYAIYNYTLESIAGDLSAESPLPVMEENAADIAYNFRMKEEEVQNIITFCVSENLLSKNEQGEIICLKMYKFLDDVTRKSPAVMKLLKAAKEKGFIEVPIKSEPLPKSDKVRISPIKSDKVRTSPNKSEQVRINPIKSALDLDIDLDINTYLLAENPKKAEFTLFVSNFCDELRRRNKNFPVLSKVNFQAAVKSIEIVYENAHGLNLGDIKNILEWALDDKFWKDRFFSLSRLDEVGETGYTRFETIQKAYDFEKKKKIKDKEKEKINEVQTKANQQAELILSNIKAVGRNGNTLQMFHDKITLDFIYENKGWANLCNQKEKDLPTMAKKFKKYYSEKYVVAEAEKVRREKLSIEF